MTRRNFCVSLMLFLIPGSLLAEEVYRSDFAKGVSEEVWSSARTPARTHPLEPGGETVYGIFADQGAVRMSLGELPDHKLVRLRFDLLLSGGFDGNRGKHHADLFSIQQVDGPLLWNGSICVRPTGGDWKQSFPDEWPQGEHPAQTGRVHDRAEKVEGMPQRYHFDLSFPHDSKEIGLIFRLGVNINGERWSFSNFIVDAMPELQPLPAMVVELDDLRGEFAGADPVVANKAVWRFIAAGEAGSKAIAAGELGALTKKQKLALEKQFNDCLAGLSHDEFVKRQAAAAALAKLDPAAIKLVDAAIAKRSTHAGVRSQLKRIRKKLEAKVGAKEAHTRLIAARVSHVQRVLDRERLLMRVTSSKKPSPAWDHECSVTDGFAPPISAMFHSPRFCWYPQAVGDGWLRLDFTAARPVSEFGVFWFWDDFGVNPPASWKLEFLAADKKTWHPVANPSEYKTEADKFNEVRFDKVETSALRLVATFNGKKSAGVHEVRVK